MKPPVPGGRILDDLTRLRLHQADHAVNEGARCEVLPCAGLLLGGILFQKTFIEIAEPLLARREPIELVDVGRQRLEVGRLPELGLGVSEDGEDCLVLGLLGVAEVEHELAVVRQLVEARALGEFRPTVFLGQLVLVACLGQHLEE